VIFFFFFQKHTKEEKINILLYLRPLTFPPWTADRTLMAKFKNGKRM